jgi:hypothetical protein
MAGELLNWYENSQGERLAKIKIGGKIGIIRLVGSEAILRADVVVPLVALSNTSEFAHNYLEEVAQSWLDEAGGEALPSE